MTQVISREWAMPNSNTFQIKPIKELIKKYTKDCYSTLDPFAKDSYVAKFRNDLNPNCKAEYHMDALDFLKMWDNESMDLVFYDPPYSLRQVSECYKGVGKEVTNETTQSSWRSKHLDEIARITKVGGYCISFGWNSNGVGKKRGFEPIEILLVAHGGSHNDTIVTVERKCKGE